MSETEEPDDPDVRYDLAGNPLPAAPKPAVPLPSAPPPLMTPGGNAPPGLASLPGQAPVWGSPTPVSRTPILLWGLGGAAPVLLALAFGILALRPVTVPAPASYKTYTAIDNTFSCDQPVGWTMHETGATSGALSTATFEQSHVRVRVISDSIGSLRGDMATASNNSVGSVGGDMPLPPGLPPPPPAKPAVEQLHEQDKAQLADSLPDYQEGEMKPLESRVGDSRLSEWTADGGKMHGYRVTMLGNQREITVICLSPERNWAILQPAFQRIISSVVPGSG